MPAFVEMDERTPLSAQMEEKVGPVILNQFTVEPNEADHLLTAWVADAAWMKRQPGFISAQLHRGIGGSRVFVNYAVWESTEHFKRAFRNLEFQSKLGDYLAEYRGVSPSLQEGGSSGHLCDVARVSSAGRAPTPRQAGGHGAVLGLGPVRPRQGPGASRRSGRRSSWRTSPDEPPPQRGARPSGRLERGRVAMLDQPALAIQGFRPRVRLHQLVGAVGPQAAGLDGVREIGGEHMVSQVPEEPRVLDGEEDLHAAVQVAGH
jgi:heme-degrading monooxygenase HmoA